MLWWTSTEESGLVEDCEHAHASAIAHSCTINQKLTRRGDMKSFRLVDCDRLSDGRRHRFRDWGQGLHDKKNKIIYLPDNRCMSNKL